MFLLSMPFGHPSSKHHLKERRHAGQGHDKPSLDVLVAMTTSLSECSVPARFVNIPMLLQRKGAGAKSLSSGDNHMKYSDDEGDGMGNADDMDDLEGGMISPLILLSLLLSASDPSLFVLSSLICLSSTPSRSYAFGSLHDGARSGIPLACAGLKLCLTGRCSS